ncbi:MAG TPA: hypothetical protein VF439_03315 [Candidatus Paceibacterota bacterium]
MMMIELLIALAIFALVMGGVALMRSLDAAAPVYIDHVIAATTAAENVMQEARERAASDFANVTSTTSIRDADTVSLEVADVSPCLKQATAAYSYDSRHGITDEAAFTTLFASPAELRRLGGDCDSVVPPASIELSNGSTFAVGTTTAFDVLRGTAYIGIESPPYLAIVKMPHDVESRAFSNGFALPAKPNALDAAAVERADGITRTYLYAALATSSGQFAVADVTDPDAPVLVAVRSLAGVAGEEPGAWRVLYYERAAYVTTRRTAGPELHRFDVSDPNDPKEEGSGLEINSTINALAARDEGPDASSTRYLFAAAERAGGELAVYDVTDARHGGDMIELPDARVDLPGTEDALSLALNGSRLYLGREASGTAPELFAFDASNPSRALPLIGSADASAAITSMRAWGPYLLLSTGRAGKEAELWNVASASAMAPLSNMPIAKAFATDIEDAMLYVLSPEGVSLFALNPS